MFQVINEDPSLFLYFILSKNGYFTIKNYLCELMSEFMHPYVTVNKTWVHWYLLNVKPIDVLGV